MPNARRTFWVIDGANGERRQVQARLRVLTSHIAMWVEEGRWHDVRALQAAAEHLETETCPKTRAIFGSEWTPGIDNDPHLHVLHVGGLQETVLGYASMLDELPGAVHPFSNEAELITINTDVVETGSPIYEAVVARELVRLIQWHQDPNEESWVREGLVELGAAMAGWDTQSLEHAYLDDMDVSLTAWENTDAQRGAAYLLMANLHRQLGDEGVRELTAQASNGTAGFSAALETLDSDLTFEAFFCDWLAVTYLESVSQAKSVTDTSGVSQLLGPSASGVYTTYPVTITGSVNQLGADVIVLHGDGDLQVSFRGTDETELVAGAPDIGHAWWSNRVDASFATLTRTLDLRDATQAALSYRIWYDIEQDFDYGTLEVSADEGHSWQILQTSSGTGANPHGNNPGWGYTGSSGGWVDETVDLSAYAGERIQVRFGYLTDAALTGEGVLLNHISLDRDNAEMAWLDGSPGWHTGGFVLTDARVPQRYLGMLITAGPDVEVESLSFERDRTAVWTLPLGREDVDEAAIILSAMAPFARLPASYTLTIAQ